MGEIQVVFSQRLTKKKKPTETDANEENITTTRPTIRQQEDATQDLWQPVEPVLKLGTWSELLILPIIITYKY